MPAQFTCVFYFLVFCLCVEAEVLTHGLNISYSDGTFNSIQTDHPVLPEENVTQTCNTGVWIIYGGRNYTIGESYITILTNLDAQCHVPEGPFRSARTVGINSDVAKPSVTIFSGPFLTGEAEVTHNGLPNITVPIESLVTINKNVELFDETDYHGNSFCVNIPPTFCDQGVCYLWSSGYAIDPPWDILLAKSAKIGCTHSKTHESRSSPKIAKPNTIFQESFN